MAIKRNITYLNKDFSDFRSQLIDFSQTYFPNTYSDFDDSSPGLMFIEQASYVGDVLSFYMDNQIQENFVQYARQTNNLYSLAYMFGYKPKVTGLATVDIDFYQFVPSITSGSQSIPDYNYSLIVDANSTISNSSNQSFIIEDSIDFSVSNSLDPTTVTVAQISGGEPTYYLLKKTRKAVSGTINTTTVSFTNYEEFKTIQLNADNIGAIIDVFDSDGNQWHEVNYLAQELIYVGIKNSNENDPNNALNSDDTPYILSTEQVQRRFVTRFKNENTLEIQFGAGDPANTDEEVIPNPQNVGIGLPFEKTKLTTAYSPTNFIFTNTYGVAPVNTTLTIRYLTGGGVSSNVSANSLTSPSTSGVRFVNSNLNESTANYIFSTFATNNAFAATGGKDGDTIEELRQNILSSHATQLRSVTADDYLIRALSLPSRYGVISKAFAQKPQASSDLNTLDLYILTQNNVGNLTTASSSLKKNLRTYLNQYRMIGDTIGIKDAFIINIGCEFEIITEPNYNNNEVLLNCIQELQTYFDISRWQINQPIILREIYQLLDNVPGTQSIKNVKITNKVGVNSGYSIYAYDVEGATQNGVVYPSIDPSIFEVKYLNDDIKGKISII